MTKGSKDKLNRCREEARLVSLEIELLTTDSLANLRRMELACRVRNVVYELEKLVKRGEDA